MRRIALALLAALLPSIAFGQAGTQFSAGQVYGNSTGARAPGKAETVTAILDRALGSTRGAIIERGSAGWAIIPPGTAGLPYRSGGAGADGGYSALALSALATQATNTIVGNATSGTAAPTALAVGSCSTTSSALTWTTNTGFGCNTSIVAASATTTAITDDTTTNASMLLTWVTAATGNLPQKVSSTKLTFNPSTGALSSTSFSGAGTGLTGTAASLTAGTVTTNANLTGPVTSVGNATSVTANAITRAMEAQGIARSVIGNCTNATANVADVQGTANQVMVQNSAGTACAFGQVNLASSAAVTGTLPIANGGTGDTGTAWATFTPSASCGTGTFTTTSARSKTLGKTMWIEVDFTITALNSCTASMTFSLPSVTAQSGGGMSGREFGVSGKGFNCDVRAASATATCSLADFTNFSVNAHMVASGAIEIQ